jgi:hypothetical protein
MVKPEGAAVRVRYEAHMAAIKTIKELAVYELKGLSRCHRVGSFFFY